MAKICVVCGGFCAYFLLLLNVSAVFSISERYIYNDIESIHQSNHFFDWDLLPNDDGSHKLHKRDLFPQAMVTPETKEPVSKPIPLPNSTLTSPIPTNKSKLPKAASKTMSTSNFTKLDVKAVQKMLGENGTGQRKNLSITEKPPIVLTHLPIPIPTSSPTAPTSTRNPFFENSTPLIDDADVSILSKAFNSTLAKHNITSTRNDTNMYYNSTLMSEPETSLHYWVDLDNNNSTTRSELLSQSHRRAATVQLMFDFPFYGHSIRNVTIATGGFLYTGDYVHSWLAATQYIAPLMANFDTSLSNESFIKFADNGTAFTVEWEKVALQDRPDEGEFTFQTTLHKNGDIVFVYRNVPVVIEQIQDHHHPVKVGLSDAYIIDRTIFFMNRKTIYEYHRVNFAKEDIKNGTVIYLKALPTCPESKDCSTCLTREVSNFECTWCGQLNRCSNGVDRYRQQWLMKGCDKRQIRVEAVCSHVTSSDIFDDNNKSYNHDANEFSRKKSESIPDSEDDEHALFDKAHALGVNQPVKMGVSGIVAILFLIAMVSGLAVWVLYAYRNPHTTSGQILIRYRPSQWRWRRGEARYTAATIHM